MNEWITWRAVIFYVFQYAAWGLKYPQILKILSATHRSIVSSRSISQSGRHTAGSSLRSWEPSNAAHKLS
jgi:F0F1-type ATP synthase membrane subunit b/b'